jgi:uncharacterized damage-inducible protein DinB
VAFQLKAQSADTLFIRAAAKKLNSSREYTLKVAGLMPAAQFGFRPSPDQMTFGEQLLHLSLNLGWLSSSYLNGGEHPVQRSEAGLQDKDSIMAVIRRVYDYALDAVENFPPGHLKDSVTFFAGPMNKIQIINLINDHQAHHRGQLIVYLRMNGIKPPPYVGW